MSLASAGGALRASKRREAKWLNGNFKIISTLKWVQMLDVVH